MLAGLQLHTPESPGAPKEPSGCAAANATTAQRSKTLEITEPMTFEQLQTEAASLSASLLPVSCTEQSEPQGAMQALLDLHPLAPAWARAQALQAWAALEDVSNCTGSEVAESRSSGRAGRPGSAAASSCSTSLCSASRPQAAGRGSCGSARSVRSGQRRCTWAGAISAAGPAGGSMEGRRAEQRLCTKTPQGNQAEPSCCMDAQKSLWDRPAAEQQATAGIAGGSSVAYDAEGPPKQAWSAEEDAWVAHAQWMAAHADGADGRRAARHLLAQLLPGRSSTELLARWRWCCHTLVTRGTAPWVEAPSTGSLHPVRVLPTAREALVSNAYAILHLLEHTASGSGPNTTEHRQARGASAVADALHGGECLAEAAPAGAAGAG